MCRGRLGLRLATRPRCRDCASPFPGLLLFTLDPHLIILKVKQGGIKYYFWVLGMTWHGVDIGMMVRVFANGVGDLGSIPCRVIPKTQKWYLMPPCLTLSNIRLGSRGKWSNPEKGIALSLHLSVVAIKKGAFVSTSTKGWQLYFLLISVLATQENST